MQWDPRTAPIPCPPHVSRCSPSVHTNSAREETLHKNGAVTTADVEYTNDGRFRSLRLYIWDSVNDDFLAARDWRRSLTYGEKRVFQTQNKALLAYSIFVDTRKYRCFFDTTMHAINSCKSYRTRLSEELFTKLNRNATRKLKNRLFYKSNWKSKDVYITYVINYKHPNKN